MHMKGGAPKNAGRRRASLGSFAGRIVATVFVGASSSHRSWHCFPTSHSMSRSAAVAALARLWAQAETSPALARGLVTLAGQHQATNAHTILQGSAGARAAAWTGSLRQALGSGASPTRLAFLRQLSSASEGEKCALVSGCILVTAACCRRCRPQPAPAFPHLVLTLCAPLWPC